MNASNKTVFNTLASDRSLRADELHRILRENCVDFATGVPCGVLRHIIRNFADDASVLHVIANRESEAVGLAAGAFLGGKTPVVYMQNSGLFSSSNDIASLLVPYNIPIFFVISYRGCEGEDAVQHLTTGRATESLLQSLGLSFVVFDNQPLVRLVGSMFDSMHETRLPAFLLLKRGWHG
jgi:sulfopyruvate decarboxylase subunit alpha